MFFCWCTLTMILDYRHNFHPLLLNISGLRVHIRSRKQPGHPNHRCIIDLPLLN